MLISIQSHLLYTAKQPCNLLLQIEGASDAAQHCQNEQLTIHPDTSQREIKGEEGIGTRRWLTAGNQFDCRYTATFDVTRSPVVIANLPAADLTQTPSDVTKFLMPSRYCHPEAFFEFVPKQFGNLSGGALVLAISNWIRTEFTYDNGASHAATTATDSFEQRAGVCRDYAHVLIAMTRAAGIPARIVSAYAPDVQPQDFHAVAEVYLDGKWHLIDPTGMAQAPDIVRIGVGRDAADVSFMTSYGFMTLKNQSVQVTRVD